MNTPINIYIGETYELKLDTLYLFFAWSCPTLTFLNTSFLALELEDELESDRALRFGSDLTLWSESVSLSRGGLLNTFFFFFGEFLPPAESLSYFLGGDWDSDFCQQTLVIFSLIYLTMYFSIFLLKNDLKRHLFFYRGIYFFPRKW